MKRVLRKSKFGYALSLILFLLGISAIIFVFWRVWLKTGSVNGLASAFLNSLWTEEFNLAAGISFKLIFPFIFGIIAITFSSIILAFSRKWFVIGEKVLVECPFCKRMWRTNPQKALVHCPFCRQLVHPKIVEE
ncbi:hypothetical protein DRO54_07560 [Candidatus Bathyarchaeota archaeon]|nr:MAG: hypothetical protein DRO54_07560 [Candidatus Bathyarchaeota archaeon]